MSEVRTISMTSEQWAFIKTKGYSPSRLIQAMINQRMNGEENLEYYKTRAELLAIKYQECINFLEKEGLTDVFFNELDAKNKRIGRNSIKAKSKLA